MSLFLPLKSAIRTTKAHLTKLEKLNLSQVQHLLEFFPRKIESTEVTANYAHLRLGEKNTLYGTLVDFRKEKTPRGRTLGKASLILADRSSVEAVWFSIPYVLKNLREESRVFLVGKVDQKYGVIQISNPEVHLQKGVHVDTLRAIYPESPPITSKWMREKVTPLLVFAKDFPEIIPPHICQNESLMNKAAAIKAIHTPTSADEWEEARRRLAFEEIFELQTRVIQKKIQREREQENTFPVEYCVETIKNDLSALPFELTTAQKKCLHHICTDMTQSRPMHRLMQGDVGSGKTIVSFLAALQTARSGHQVAILAPTEILATQHFSGALKFFPPEYGLQLLTGSVTAKKKKEIKEQLRTGTTRILIGTHAILTEDTIFKNLGLVVIDEQHRFGVHQRSLLAENNAHILAMTATPIPRTMALTIYGDQDLCVINELPPGRIPIITRVIGDPKTQTLCYRFIDDQIKKGYQIFWICPLIDESDTIEAKNVKAEYDNIANNLFPSHRVQFLHGKMKPSEKNEIMEAFKNHEFDILVSTSVIEVGVDIPNATVMVIENSERFGLAQLHQFRGRIGRNDVQSYCFLMVGKTEDKHKERLKAMEKSNDGMYLSEVDLKLRGSGEVYGTRQSGLPDFKCADLSDVETLSRARDWATEILKEDIELRNYPELRKRIEEEEVYF